MCAGLEFAHRRNIVHRDVKPGNILLDENGEVQVADFGIARVAAADTEETALTVVGSTMGTVSYMAPEQRLDAARADARADVFSLGVVLHEMLTGRIPEGRFGLPSTLRDGVGADVDAILDRALQPVAANRFADAGEMREAIATARDAAPPAAPSPIESGRRTGGGPSRFRFPWSVWRRVDYEKPAPT